MWKLSATSAREPTAYPSSGPLGVSFGDVRRRRERKPRTDYELDKEEENIDHEQEYYACFARHHGCMQALGRRRDVLWWESATRKL